MKSNKCKHCSAKALLGLGGMCGGHYWKWWEKNVGYKKPKRPRHWRADERG